MFDTARLDRAGGVHDTDPDPPAQLGQRAAGAGLRTASLDEVVNADSAAVRHQMTATRRERATVGNRAGEPERLAAHALCFLLVRGGGHRCGVADCALPGECDVTSQRIEIRDRAGQGAREPGLW
jgi:hypothetical protein